MTARHPSVTSSGIPVLPALPAHGGCCLRVWCCHCKCWHQHGAGPGHRVAHCHTEASPYHETGYILAPAEVTR
jgi:hypothetical protein